MPYFDAYGFHTDEVLDGRFTDTPLPDEPLPAGSQWNWTGLAWVPLEPYDPSAVQPPQGTEPAPRHITVGSFFDRFGLHKWPILADTSPVVQALIKDCSVRTHINLDDPQLPAGLGLLVEAGHAIDVQAIVTAAVQDGERP